MFQNVSGILYGKNHFLITLYEIKRIISEILSIDIGDGIRFEFVKIEPIREEDDYFKWEEEEMKNHKIINSRNLAIALIIVVILFAGSVFVMNRKINSLYETTVNLQQQVEELRKSE